MPMLCEGWVREKVDRFEDKIRRQKDLRPRYVHEIVDGRYHISAHVDMAAARAYVGENPSERELLPWSRMGDEERTRARLAKDKLEMALDAKHGTTKLEVVA